MNRLIFQLIIFVSLFCVLFACGGGISTIQKDEINEFDETLLTTIIKTNGDTLHFSLDGDFTFVIGDTLHVKYQNGEENKLPFDDIETILIEEPPDTLSSVGILLLSVIGIIVMISALM